jgi:hypothetical protein
MVVLVTRAALPVVAVSCYSCKVLLLWHADLRSNAERHAAGVSSSGSPINNTELLRRLRETQALLVKFSEENGRLARDNEKLQVGQGLLMCASMFIRQSSVARSVCAKTCVVLEHWWLYLLTVLAALLVIFERE